MFKIKVDELDVVEWFNIFASRVIDCCIDQFYEMVWSFFQKHITTKLPWITGVAGILEKIRSQRLLTGQKMTTENEKTCERIVFHSMVGFTMIATLALKKRLRAVLKRFKNVQPFPISLLNVYNALKPLISGCLLIPP
jgi:hypothetical protein